MKQELIAPCGMNCEICLAFFGYSFNDKKRKTRCIGCRPRNKNCAFIIKRCEKLRKKTIDFCYECKGFPCINLEKLDKRYRERFDMSMIENLKFIEANGIQKFLRQQEEKYKCPNCGGIICVHTKKCYTCNS